MCVSDQARALWSREDMRGGVMRGAGRALRFELAHRSEAAGTGSIADSGLCGGRRMGGAQGRAHGPHVIDV